VLSGGDQLSGRSDRDWQRQADFMVDVVGEIGLDVAALQATDLCRGLEHYLGLAERGSFPVISANLMDAEGRRVLPAYQVFELEGKKLGVLAISHPRQQNFMEKVPSDLHFAQPRELLVEAVRALREDEGCQAVVALIGARSSGARDMAAGIDGIDLILYGNASTSKAVPVETDQGTPITTAASRGREIGEIVLTLRDDGSVHVGPMTIHMLTRQYEDDPEILARVQDFKKGQQQRAEQARALQVQASEFATLEAEDNFLGTRKCDDCHRDIVAAYEHGPHAGSLITLEASGSENDASCVPCHVTGWAMPNGYGQLDLELRDLDRVQCEACHGYGTAHARDGGMLETARASCAACHGAERPEGCAGGAQPFDYDKAWRLIAH